MKNKINGFIEKWDIQLAFRNGQEGLAVFGKPTAAEVAEIKALKPEIMAELQRRKDTEEAAKAAEAAKKEAARQDEIRAIKAGEKNIVLHWHDGEYLSGWEVYGEAAHLLEEIGLAEYVTGWGYLVSRETVDALGEEFTYPEAVEFTRPAREEEAAKKAAANRERQAKFNEARETGKPVLLKSWTEPCNDPREECSLDGVRQYAMPDGTIRTERNHTW